MDGEGSLVIWSVEMRLLVDDERWDVLEVEQQLMKAVAIVDARPRFITAEYWLVRQTEELKSLPEPVARPTRYESEHVARAPRRRLGAGPQS